MTGRRYPFADLARAMGVTEAAACRHLNLAGSTAKEYRHRGVTARVADRLAAKAGLPVAAVWPSWVDDLIADQSRPCVECGQPFVPSRSGVRYCGPACSTRRASREWHRRRYQTDPDHRAAKIEAARAYRAHLQARRAQRRRPIPCAECGAEFLPTKVGHRYCAKACNVRAASRAYRQRQREARAAAQHGTEQAASRWTLHQRTLVDHAIAAVAARLDRFTADDVWAELDGAVPVTKGLTARLLVAARAGLISNTGETTIAARGGAHDHAQRLTVWASTRTPTQRSA